MRIIKSSIKGKKHILVYTSEVKKEYVEFKGTLYTEPPFEFKYIIHHYTKEAAMFEPIDSDKIVRDRITQLVQRDYNSVNK